MFKRRPQSSGLGKVVSGRIAAFGRSPCANITVILPDVRENLWKKLILRRQLFDFSLFYLKYTVALQIKGLQGDKWLLESSLKVTLFDMVSQNGSCGQ